MCRQGVMTDSNGIAALASFGQLAISKHDIHPHLFPPPCGRILFFPFPVDHRSGDVVCRGCGEVQAERLVDLGAEWNRYDDNDGKGDPSRVGGELGGVASRIWGGTSASAPGGRGSQGMGKKRKGQGSAMTGAELANKKSRAQSKLEKVCMLLSDAVRSLHLDERVTQVGFTVADAANTEGAFRGKPENTLVGAILYLSCKHCGVLKSIAEVCAQLGLNKFDVGRVINDISRKVKSLEAVVFSPEDVVDKYGGQLRLPLGLRAAAVEVMKAAKEMPGLEGLHPQSLAGAALLLLSNTKVAPHLVLNSAAQEKGMMKIEVKDEDLASQALPGLFPPPQRSLEDVTGATLMSTGTIKRAHSLLYEHREKLVPVAYAAQMFSHRLELRATSELK